LGFIPVGWLTRPHGVRGEMRWSTQGSELPDEDIERVQVRPKHGPPRLLTITRLRPERDDWLVTFAEVKDRTAAEELAGAEVHLDSDDLPPPEPGEVYLFELTGAQAVDEAGRVLGTVKGILAGKAQDLIALDTPQGERLLPLAPDTLVKLDRAERRATFRVPEGLWDAV
jgi:16S rRNA processing protein RimM